MATASDIIDFFTIISEDNVAKDQRFVYTVMSVWTWSLMQFPCVVTSASSSESVADRDEDRADR